MPNEGKKETEDYELGREGTEEVMKINCIGKPFLSSIADDQNCMATVIGFLAEEKASRIILSSTRQYEYDFDQTQILVEIANLYSLLTKQKRVLSYAAMGYSIEYTANFASRLSFVQYIVLNLLKSDPVGAYVELRRRLREEKIRLEREKVVLYRRDAEVFINLLEYIASLLSKTKLIGLLRANLDGHVVGSRELYRQIFRPAIKPNFMLARFMAEQPLDGETVDIYSFAGNDVSIFKVPKEIKPLYHITPPEFKISEDEYELLDSARRILTEHKPRAEEFLEPTKMRETFYNIGRDMLQELADQKGYELKSEQINNLAEILVRYTVGFGLLEVLLQDDKVQDITINGPIGETPVFIVHEDYDECVTNIIPSSEDGEAWATKFRLLSARALDEANPVLDTELLVPSARARVAVITRPLSPVGLAYSIRRHRDSPWTLPLFIKNKMLNPLAAGLISFFVDGGRSLIFAGTRSSGKTSIMIAMMFEIMRKHRIITVEDTLEIPIATLRSIGYNIQPMKVRSAITPSGAEMAADEGIRTSLRMGDSSLIVGEVRSLEAKALYEAMRIGALANVVAGTIHGASPYAVFDRVVNDLGVERTSFKATDIVIVSNPVRSPDGLHKWRRVLEIAEVKKHWEEDPIREAGFMDLMTYNPVTDELELTEELKNGESDIIKMVAANVKEWAGNWDAVWDNILLRAAIKEKLVDYAVKNKMDWLLEAKFVVLANDAYHKIFDKVREEVGIDNKRILSEWEEWLKEEAKR